MTKAARVVLQDCRDSLAELEDGVQGPTWRRRWIATISLLRTVGYVLGKVDVHRSPSLERSIREHWLALKHEKPTIWAFIFETRNAVLKEYKLRAGQGFHAYAGSHVEYTYPIHEGPYAGMDQREVLQLAIDWWSGQLDDIDARAGKSGTDHDKSP